MTVESHDEEVEHAAAANRASRGGGRRATRGRARKQHTDDGNDADVKPLRTGRGRKHAHPVETVVAETMISEEDVVDLSLMTSPAANVLNRGEMSLNNF